MDFEKRARRQSLRVIISETIMVFTIIIMVSVLAFVVSGYWLNANFEVERQGMLQISSVPTGANVSVDGDSSWLQRTNTSKVLSSGAHQIILTKDGYDSWSKTVDIKEGLLYRIQYPRLFLTEREKSTVYNATSATFATVSKEHNFMLLANNTTHWALLNLENDKLDPSTIDISSLTTFAEVPDDATVGTFTGTILSADWSGDNNHVLLKIQQGSKIEWLLLDVKTMKNSINLTKEFAADFTKIQIFDHSASNLLAIRSGNLHKIDVSGRQVSAILAENVKSFATYDQEIAIVTSSYIGTLKIGDQAPKVFRYFSGAKLPSGTEIDDAQVLHASPSAAWVFLSRFYENKNLILVTENAISVYNRDDDSLTLQEPLTITPEAVTVGAAGDFVFVKSGSSVATLDFESASLTEWSLGSTYFDWLDAHMLYNVASGALSVYDYDGLNHRTLASGASERFPVTITNNKWLYYFQDGSLIREIITQ